MMDDTCCIGTCCAPCNSISESGGPGAYCMICLESFCPFCQSCTISSNRAYVMYTHSIEIDECDGRLIALSNFLQMASCICDIIATFDPQFENAAECIDFIADVVYIVVSGCMITQTHLQLKNHPHPNAYVSAG